ncbi:unnamed protein product [Ectocarpus sp. CCAP 1310/34]|nr:unnamed protein product [Ectocarpus sp. CCAP 1310/34]
MTHCCVTKFVEEGLGSKDLVVLTKFISAVGRRWSMFYVRVSIFTGLSRPPCFQ